MLELNLLTAFILKPAVMVLAVLVVAHLRRRRKEWSRIFLVAMAVFLAGELLCGVDVYIGKGMTLLFEGAHDVLMAFSYGVFLAGGVRYLNRGDWCWNYACPGRSECSLSPVHCAESGRVSSLWGWTLLAGALVASLLPAADPGIWGESLPAGWGGMIVGAYRFERTAALANLQQVWLPGVGASLLAIAGVYVLFRRRMNRVVLWVTSMGVGLVLFGFVRAFLVHVSLTRPVVGLFWEELTEALFLALFFLWLREKRVSQPAP